MAKEDINKKLDVLKNNIDQIKIDVDATINQLEAQSNLSPIKAIKKLYISNCTVRHLKDSSWYSREYIRFDVPNDCIKILNKMGLGISGDESWGYYSFNYNSEKSKENFLIILNKIFELDSKTQKENIIASQSNQRTRDTVLKMLIDLGIPKSKYTYKSNRSRTKDWVSCAWNGEIFSAFPVSIENVEERKNKLVAEFDRLYNEDQKKREAEEQAKVKEIERKEQERELAFMLAKYDLDITADWDDLLRSIIYKNKYLYLAHYMRLNRGDWNDGYSYAKSGLEGFSVETSKDQEIYDCISAICYNHEDVDGRYFRDCEWSYDILFGMVKEQNEELYNDYEKVSSKIDV